jgi:hypothetical protein
VQFVKRYDGGQRVHRDPIFYAGDLNSDLTFIEGRWTLTQLVFRISGGFRMQRGSKGPRAAVTRKVEEKAPVLVGANTTDRPRVAEPLKRRPHRNAGEGNRKTSCVRSR